jgi:DNA-binding PadR family transcriptional regulator
MYPFTELPAPISIIEFYILLTLAYGDAHAYKIKYTIVNFSKGSLKIRDGTFYRVLNRMADQGMIEVAGIKQPITGRQRRMHYSLGHHGRRALRFELDRLEHTLALAKSAGLLDSPPPTPVDMLLEDMGLPSANV